MRLSDELRTERQTDRLSRPMSDRGWKKAERRVAKALGGKRVPFSGGLAPTSGLPKTDVTGTIFDDVEVKTRKRWDVRGWIRLLEGRTASSTNHLPWLLVIKKPRSKRTYAVLTRYSLNLLVQLAGLGDIKRVFLNDFEKINQPWRIEQWIEEAEAYKSTMPWLVGFFGIDEMGVPAQAYVLTRFEIVVGFVQEVRSKMV